MKLLLPKLDSASETIMGNPLDIKTTISILSVMNGQELVTKKLIGNILRYSSLITESIQT